MDLDKLLAELDGIGRIARSWKEQDRVAEIERQIILDKLRHIYEKAGFFTPPYETVSSLKKWLEHMYTAVTLENVKGIAWFVCRKEAKTETENEEQKETKA